MSMELEALALGNGSSSHYWKLKAREEGFSDSSTRSAGNFQFLVKTVKTRGGRESRLRNTASRSLEGPARGLHPVCRRSFRSPKLDRKPSYLCIRLMGQQYRYTIGAKEQLPIMLVSGLLGQAGKPFITWAHPCSHQDLVPKQFHTNPLPYLLHLHWPSTGSRNVEQMKTFPERVPLLGIGQRTQITNDHGSSQGLDRRVYTR